MSHIVTSSHTFMSFVHNTTEGIISWRPQSSYTNQQTKEPNTI
jgi:hypothetical protein